MFIQTRARAGAWAERPTVRIPLDTRASPTSLLAYVLKTSEGKILYVRMAANLNARFQQHLDNPEKTGSTDEGRAYFSHFLERDSNALNQLERSWLNQYAVQHGIRPMLNKMDSPVS